MKVNGSDKRLPLESPKGAFFLKDTKFGTGIAEGIYLNPRDGGRLPKTQRSFLEIKESSKGDF